jgi:hypothetical protein
MIAQLEAGLSVVDKAAAASDRWLFLAALVNSLERKDTAHAAAESVVASIVAQYPT